MKDVRLKSLNISNFKGIKKMNINFNCLDANIYGKNATGKTTIVDAFMWLFFNKDSNGSSDFEIKTKKESGEYIHNLEHIVEAVIDDRGHEIKFMKKFKEKYTKQRGSTTAVFTGHTTDYFIDDVPKKKKEFDSTVNDLFDSKYFQIITDPLFFNKKMKWQDRRSLLIDICGDVSDELVIASNGDLAPLLSVIARKSIDDYRLQLKSQMKPINEELKMIPVKINEAQLAIPNDIESIDEEKLDFINERIKDLESKRAIALNGGMVAEKETELIKLQNKKLMIENEVPKTKKMKDELYGLEFKKSAIERDIQSCKNKIALKESDQKQNEYVRNDLRKKYYEINDMQYDESQNICPHCKQPLPAEQVADFMEKFNIKKSNDLQSIEAKGKYFKEEFDKRKDEIDNLSKDIEAKKKDLEVIQKEIDEKQLEIDSVFVKFKADQQPKIDSINKQIDDMKSEISTLKENAGASTLEIDQEINTLKYEKSQIESIKAKMQLAEIQEKRIKDLEQKESELSNEFNNLDQMLYLTDLFIKQKVDMLTEKINNHFRLCKFKLFEEQINGGLNEVCEVMVNGVSYSDLNNAMQINAGLDVINTICNFTQSFAPIFIDNCESINDPIQTNSQQIRLYVTDSDDVLRIEND